MSPKTHAVTVHQIPSRISSTEAKHFLRQLRPFVTGERPRLVLDCSSIERIDDSVIHLLLCCLEEAMKGNGDARLGGVSEAGQAALRRAQLHRLFEFYATPAAAVHSYSSYLGEGWMPVPATLDIAAVAETAA